jgi:hypothetical protein
MSQRLNLPKSRRSICNLFAEFLLNKIGLDSKTIIQVTDCNNFFVVNGMTESEDILGVFSLKDEFNEKYKDLIETPITHTFDLIKYGVKVSERDTLQFTYYTTSDNVSYHYSQLDNYTINNSGSYFDGLRSHDEIENNYLSVSSEFPYGYSLNQGRLLYYYGKHIAYNFTNSITEPKISLTLTSSHSEEDKLISVYGDNPYPDEKLKSYLLDMFDFNYEKLNEEIKKVDLSLEITNPLEDFECLKKKIKLDLFI